METKRLRRTKAQIAAGVTLAQLKGETEVKEEVKEEILQPLTAEQAKLVEENIGLAKKWASLQVTYGKEFDEMFQLASLELCKTSQSFDDTKGNLSTYFFQHMKWALIKYNSEFSRQVGVTKGVLVDKEHDFHKLSFISLDSTAKDAYAGDDEDGAAFAETVGAEDKSIEKNETKQLVQKLLARLDDRARKVIELRFLEDLSLAEIAPLVGVSIERVRQIIESNLPKLRQLA